MQAPVILSTHDSMFNVTVLFEYFWLSRCEKQKVVKHRIDVGKYLPINKVIKAAVQRVKFVISDILHRNKGSYIKIVYFVILSLN